MATTTREHNYPTQPGWYAIGQEDVNGVIEYGPIYEFTGAEWLDEDGELVTSLWDPILECRVAMDAADSYVRQN